MMNQVYRDDGVTLTPLEDKTVGVLGYGIQGRAWALNLRDSGLNVIVGDESPTRDRAEEDGWKVLSFADATREADVVCLVVADPAQPEVYERSVHENLAPGKTLVFAHGFNVVYGLIQPPPDVNVGLFVPNGPGHVVREKYLQGSGIYGAVAVEQDFTGDAMQVVLAVAKGLGEYARRSGRSGLLLRDRREQFRGAGPVRRNDRPDAGHLRGDGRQRLSSVLRLRQGDQVPALGRRCDGRARHRGVHLAAQ